MNGIGGRSIAEARECLSIREFQLWSVFRAKRGSLNLGGRIDEAAGMLAALFVNSNTKPGSAPFKRTDFMPYADPAPISLEEAMKQW
ncbi:phage tail protein [Stenotrophomonas sp. HMWF023]|nr:phage tail protein [Stenotrophomonas sp. HMWF023]